MPEKLNYAGQMQPYDESDGQYKRFSSFHRPSENKLKGKTFYHGSPNKNITSFDESYAGSNVGTDFSGIFFTDNKDFAEDFAYERKDSGSKFYDIKGEKGKVYQAELDMKNPLDLNNLTDKELKDIEENYLIDNGLGKEENMRLLETYLKAGNIQGVKIFIDFKKMAKDGKYDGYIADLGSKYKGSNEYVIFKGSQAKIKNEQENSYTDNYIKNNKFLDNLDEKTRESFIENFKNLPKSQQYYYSLPKEEQFSLNAMQMDTRNINEYMSGRRTDFDDELKKDLDERIKNVKNAISKYNLEEPITLYRGVGKDEFDRVQTDGKTTSFKSASTNEKIANMFAKNQGGYIIEYKVGKGSRVADVDGLPMADEDEYLIDSDIKYKKITKNGNRIIVEI